MHKYKRHEEITRLVNEQGILRVSEIVSLFNITDMTARRDLSELEEQGILTKIHGGARSNSIFSHREISHQEKHHKNIDEKKAIAKIAVGLIEEGDTIFLGPGTTIELLAREIKNARLSVVTNCYPVFKHLYAKKTENFNVYLLGGQMRELTESFVGEITNTSLEKMKFSKMFFSGNGVKSGDVMTSSFAEAFTQQIAIKNSIEKYLLVDLSKIGKEDFVTICSLSELTGIITEDAKSEKVDRIRQFTEVIE